MTTCNDPPGALCGALAGETVDPAKGALGGVGQMVTVLGLVLAMLLLVFWVLTRQAHR